MNDLTFSKEDAVEIKVLEVNQPIGKFYVGITKASHAISICSAKVRTKDGLEEYIGIQRPLNDNRVKEIKTYVTTWDASFPNSVILSINPGYFFFKGDFIYIKKDKKAANIIDGQHRLAGFDEEDEKDFDIILALFPDLELEEQAYLFSVINTKMTRINPSLAKDLYAFATINTPEKLAHNIAKYFNEEEDNPWYGKIKMLGRKEIDQDAVLSQSTFTREIINLICDTRDSYKIRHLLKVNNNDRSCLKEYYSGSKLIKYILWTPFVESQDKFLYTVLKDYFSAVRETYPNDWEDTTKILTKTTGYTALMKVFVVLYKLGLEQGKLTKNFFGEYFVKAKERGEVKDFISLHYSPGRIGEKDLATDFLKSMKLL